MLITIFLDTANAFRLAAGVLLTVTLALNAAALIVRRSVGANGWHEGGRV